ncbi:hypothetical protein WI69_04370 [Burkholderia diffusa]|nr:hypothetical protein WI69_04370 [Burkholderia diffusa]
MPLGFRDGTGRTFIVTFAAASLLPCRIFEHSRDVAEGIAQRDVDVFFAFLAGYQLMPRNRDFDPDIERFPLVIVPLVEHDIDPAMRDVLPESIQSGCMPGGCRLERFRARHALKYQFERWLHCLIRRWSMNTGRASPCRLP